MAGFLLSAALAAGSGAAGAEQPKTAIGRSMQELAEIPPVEVEQLPRMVVDAGPEQPELVLSSANAEQDVSFDKEWAAANIYWNVENAPDDIVEVSQTIDVLTSGEIPTGGHEYQEGLFSFMQFELQSSVPGVENAVGYIGVQTNNSITGLPAYQFSVWSAAGAKPAEGTSAESFDHEGVGYQSSLPVDGSYESQHSFRLVVEPGPEGLSTVSGYAGVEGSEQLISRMFVTGDYTSFAPSATNANEHYTKGNKEDCDDTPFADTSYDPPIYTGADGSQAVANRVHYENKVYPDCGTIGSAEVISSPGETPGVIVRLGDRSEDIVIQSAASSVSIERN